MAPKTPVISFATAPTAAPANFPRCGVWKCRARVDPRQSAERGYQGPSGLYISVPSVGAGPGIGTCLDPEAKITRLRVQATPCWPHLDECFLLEGIVVALSRQIQRLARTPRGAMALSRYITLYMPSPLPANDSCRCVQHSFLC